MIANSQLQAIIEGALMASSEPLTLKRLMSLFEEDGDVPEKSVFIEALSAIGDNCEGRGFELKEVASGWRIQVREDLAPWVNRLWDEKPQKYSRASLETLALIAYRQPITRGDIEEIRGVAVSSHIIRTLIEREWVKVVGQRDVPGRPSLYATTREFLDYFNLKSLDQLPTLSEIRDLDELNAELDLGAALEQSSASNRELAPEFDGVSEQVHPESENLPSAGEAAIDTSEHIGDDALEKLGQEGSEQEGLEQEAPARLSPDEEQACKQSPESAPTHESSGADDNTENYTGASADSDFTDPQESDREL